MRARLVEESINFERTSNPLSSMGLGGFSFDTLQPGAIIQSKRYFGVTEKTGNIKGYHSAIIKIGRGNYLLITEVRKTGNPAVKNISFHRYTSLSQAKEEKEKFREGGTRVLSWWGIPRGFLSDMSKFKFDYRFDIIEPGFNVDESINFERGREPRKALSLGRPFGFTKDLLDLSHNDGKKILFVRPDFVEKLKAEGIYQYDKRRLYLGNELIGRWGYRKKDYRNQDGSYKGPYSCNFRLYNRMGDLYMLQGSSGDYGFGGMQRTQSGTIGTTFRKSLYEQAYNYLMEKWIGPTNEGINFERGGNIYRGLKIGRSFWNLEPGAILKPLRDIYIGPRTNFVSGPYGTKIWEESYVTVIDLEKTPSGLMKIYYHQNWDLAGAEVVRDNIKLYPRGLSMTGTEKQFKNRFIIHES